MPSLATGDWLYLAADIIQSQLPLASALYYFVALSIRFAFVQTSGQTTSSPSLQNGIFYLMACVLLAYSTEAALIVYGNLGQEQPFPEGRLVYYLWSLLLWTILLRGLTKHGHARRFGPPHWGCSVLYTAGEGVLLRSGSTCHHPFKSCYLTLQAFRLVIFTLLCGLPILHKLRARVRQNRRRTGGEEAIRALLQHISATHNAAGYSTITNRNESDTHTNGAARVSARTYQILKELLPFMWPTGQIKLQLLYVGLGLCILAGRLLNVLIPMQLGAVTDALTTRQTFPWQNIIYYAVLQLLGSDGGLGALQAYLWQPLENEMKGKIGKAAFDKVMDLSCDFHETKKPGEITNAVGRTQTIYVVINSVFFNLVPMAIDLCLAITVLHTVFGPYMGLITTVVIVLFVWSSGNLVTLNKPLLAKFAAANNEERNILHGALDNWVTVSIFDNISYEKNRYFCAVDNVAKTYTPFLYSNKGKRTVLSIVLTLGQLAACFLVVHQIISSSKEVGSFVMLTGYWSRLSGPLRFFENGFSNLTIQLANAEEFIALLKKEPSIKETSDARELIVQAGGIRFKDVTFSYDGKKPILRGVSFEVRPGQTLAIVGESGSGKSTILKLLSRFYDVTQGTIEIDGQNIKDVTLESLRRNIGVVPQAPAMFHDTIMYNLRYANMTATDEEIQDACKSVYLHDHFKSIEGGYHASVGAQNSKLSGGEIQRMAIARVILQNPVIALLDEATSSVDSKTERKIQESLAKHTAGKTKIVVAHRLSTIMNADVIVVMDHGRKVEEGTHYELINANGLYSELWKEQFPCECAHVDKGTGKSSLKPQAAEFVPQQTAN